MSHFLQVQIFLRFTNEFLQFNVSVYCKWKIEHPQNIDFMYVVIKFKQI